MTFAQGEMFQRTYTGWAGRMPPHNSDRAWETLCDDSWNDNRDRDVVRVVRVVSVIRWRRKCRTGDRTMAEARPSEHGNIVATCR